MEGTRKTHFNTVDDLEPPALIKLADISCMDPPILIDSLPGVLLIFKAQRHVIATVEGVTPILPL